VLAYFTSKTYTDYEKRETGAQYEAGLELPDGWNLRQRLILARPTAILEQPIGTLSIL